MRQSGLTADKKCALLTLTLPLAMVQQARHGEGPCCYLSDGGGTIPAVRGLVVERLAHLERHVDVLQLGRVHDAPLA